MAAALLLVHFWPHSVNERRAQVLGVDPEFVIPPNHGRWLLVLLHGYHADPAQFTSNAFFAELAALGSRAPIVVLPRSGPHSYWHDRREEAYATKVLRQIAAARQKYDVTKVAVGGISMGGFGALHLAALDPSAYCAVGGHSAALWTSAAATAPGAFDDAADYARNDVFAAARRGAYTSIPVWIDGGDHDPFRAADDRFARLVHVEHHVWPGGHTQGYWDAHIATYLRWYASKCA